MITNVKSMACGACGCGTFKMFCTDYRQAATGYAKRLIAECTHCNSTTTIEPATHLVLDWGDNSDGILCQMEPSR